VVIRPVAVAGIDALALTESPPRRCGGRSEAPVYLRIADTARHLHELGMSDRAIAGAIDVSDKTVAKAILLGRAYPPS